MCKVDNAVDAGNKGIVAPTLVSSLEDLRVFEQYLKSKCRSLRVLPVDTETTGLCPRRHEIVLLQLCINDTPYVIKIRDLKRQGARWDKELRETKSLLESRTSVKILHNAAFDINMIRKEGIELGGSIFDTYLAAKIFNNGQARSVARNDLGSVVRREVGVELPKELQKANWGGEITTEMLEYAKNDVKYMVQVAKSLRAKLKSAEFKGVSLMNVFQLEMSCVKLISSMQYNGFYFDIDALDDLEELVKEKEYEHKLRFVQALDDTLRMKHPDSYPRDVTPPGKDDSSRPKGKWLPRNEDGTFNLNTKTSGSIRLGTKVYQGFNPSSGKMVQVAFTDCGIILPPNSKSKVEGALSLDQNLLSFQRDKNPLIDQYLTWKDFRTQLSEVESLREAYNEKTHRIHANYKQMGTETSRLSCAGPNLQQIPRGYGFRSLFRASPGKVLVGADYSQLELRVAAELSKEPVMLDAYREGKDIHVITAMSVMGLPEEEITPDLRRAAKAINFGLIYGAGPGTLRKTAKSQYGVDMTHKEAQERVQRYRDTYSTFFRWQKKVGSETTICIHTRIGRRRFLPPSKMSDGTFASTYTKRINTRVQGAAGDITKLAIQNLTEAFASTTEDVKLISQIHDELILEVPEDRGAHWQTVLKDCMERAGSVICHDVPIVADPGEGATWGDLK